jgi:hypothetical protein
VEREGPEISVIESGKARSSSFPLSTEWRGGQGVRLRRADRTGYQALTKQHHFNTLNHQSNTFFTVGVSFPRRQVSAAFFTTSPWVG